MTNLACAHNRERCALFIVEKAMIPLITAYNLIAYIKAWIHKSDGTKIIILIHGLLTTETVLGQNVCDVFHITAVLLEMHKTIVVLVTTVLWRHQQPATATQVLVTSSLWWWRHTSPATVHVVA